MFRRGYFDGNVNDNQVQSMEVDVSLSAAQQEAAHERQIVHGILGRRFPAAEILLQVDVVDDRDTINEMQLVGEGDNSAINQ